MLAELKAGTGSSSSKKPKKSKGSASKKSSKSSKSKRSSKPPQNRGKQQGKSKLADQADSVLEDGDGEESGSASTTTNTPKGGGGPGGACGAGGGGGGVGGGGGGGDSRWDYLGMYRKIPPNGAGMLKPLHKAFARYHPWRPKGDWFVTTGYYFDWDGGGGGDDLKPNQFKVHNLPPGVTEADIKKEFPTATKIKINDNGTAIIDFQDGPAAGKAYNDSKLVKMGNRNLAWLNPDEVHLAGVPAGATPGDLENDYPGNKGIKILQEPGSERVAVIKFPSPKAADDGFEEAPYKKIGTRQNGFEIDGNPLLLTVPPNITEEDIKKKFPGATDVHVDKGTAKVKFANDEDARKAYDDSDLLKIGKPKLTWLKPEELAVEDVPKNVTAGDMKKYFPNSKNIKFINGEGGKRIAIVEFPSEDDQKKAYFGSSLKKLGPQRLGWDGSGGGKGAKPGKADPKAQLLLQNVPDGVTADDLKKQFPGATDVTLKKGGQAVIQFGTPADAEKAYNNSDMVKLGHRNLAYLKPNQLAVLDVPDKKDKPIKKDLPNLKKLKWLSGPDKTKIAIVDFADPSEKKKAYDNSSFKKVGPNLGFVGGTGGKGGGGVDEFEGMDDLEMAKKLWKLKGADFSNLSNLFSASIMLIGVPQDTKGLDLIKMFDDCKKCEFEGSGSRRTAILEFDKPTSAAKAYGKAKHTQIGGKDIKVKVIPIGGPKKKSSKHSQHSHSSKGKKK
ncbi:unnamed protein product [Allacma fusca]|uniref:RRM domain-containing protein n=1 Tax=Allacma fusca TaxID=39272 RepID=A0A8J2NSK0_9HEXA|nr:unnamed protein product [Allacma fusca]